MIALADGRRLRVRRMRPSDEAAAGRFVEALSPESRFQRFHAPIVRRAPALLRRLASADPRQFALVAEPVGAGPGPGPGPDASAAEAPLVADARWIRADDAPERAEFALVVADAWQRAGLGALLLRRLMRAARRCGVRLLEGDLLHDNRAMAGLLRQVGASYGRSADPRVRHARIDLSA